MHKLVLKQVVAVGAILATLIGVFLTRFSPVEDPDPLKPPIQGKNQTVLFFFNVEYGLTNVHMATIQALTELYPSVTIHVASFSATEKRLARLSHYREKHQPGQTHDEIVFHPLPGPTFFEATAARGVTIDNTIHPAGAKGVSNLARTLPIYVSPWSAEDHMLIYRAAREIIDDVDPALVLLEYYFYPTVDAARQANYHNAIISPMSLIHTFYTRQPYWGMFWKYPMLGTGFPFPLPWHKVLENIYCAARISYNFVFDQHARSKEKYLRAHCIERPTNYHNMYRRDSPWYAQTLLDGGAAVRPELIPANVTAAGPIVLRAGPAAEQDPALAAWLAEGAPTVLVNLGSLLEYPEERAVIMARAIEELLDRTSGGARQVQVLWKVRKLGHYSDRFAKPLERFGRRVRIMSWIGIDPLSLLETGNVIASVHHGGSSCYHEALSAGIPQVVIPIWTDLHDFAQLAEHAGVGVYATRDTAPDWTVQGLVDAFVRVVDGGDAMLTMRAKAKQLSAVVQRDPGRNIVARRIAELAAAGHA